MEQHQGGSVGWLTGAVQPGSGNYPKAPSIDQVLAGRLSTGKAYSSLEFAVRWATGKSKGKLSPMNAMFFDTASMNAPRPPRLDPQDIFTTVFGNVTGGTGTDPNAIALMRKKSILDFVGKKYDALKLKLGTEDRARLDQHLTQVRALEQRIVIPPPMTSICKQPTKVDTTGYSRRAASTRLTTAASKTPRRTRRSRSSVSS